MKATEVVTGEIRLSYANIFEARAMEEGDTKKFSTAILIPKKDKVTLAKMEKAIEVAKQEGKTKWKGKIPATLKLPLRDGDEEKPDDDNYAGVMFLNCSSVKRPKVVDENRNEILDADEVYSGCFARVALNFYPFAGKSNGIAVGLNAVQKLKDGDRLGGGGVDIDEAFGDSDDL